MESVTPHKHSHSCEQTPPQMFDDGDHGLLQTFSDLKIHQTSSTNGLLKRSKFDTMTIEGTPVNVNKRMDLHETPIMMKDTLFWFCDQTESKSETLPIVPNTQIIPNHNQSKSNPISQTKSASSSTAYDHPVTTINNQTPSKVMIICSSGNDEHNTGEHQENALRTTLLCGPDGCLRRPELQDAVEWIDYGLKNEPATIADLLRLVCCCCWCCWW